MDGRESPLYSLQQKLEETKANPGYFKQEYWRHLQESVSKMSSDQIQWTMSQDEVKETYNTMLQAFTNFLFEKYKEDFSSVPSYKPYADAYVDSILKTSVRYVDRTTQLEKELAETRKQLEELKNVGRSQTE